MEDFKLGQIVRSPKGQDVAIVEVRKANGIPEYRLQSNSQEPEWYVGDDLTILDDDGNPVETPVSPAIANRATAHRAFIDLYQYFGQDTRWTSRLDAIRLWVE